jgi:hypothetical protein
VVTSTLASLPPARDRCLPVDEAFAPLLPDAGLQRGRVVGCTGPAAISLALALASRAVAVGSWMAVVGVPMLGVEAAAQFGIPLTRLVVVDTPSSPATWAERVAAAADGFDVVLTRPPAGAERVDRKIRTRLQARGVVMIAVGPTSPGVSCDLELTTTSVAWRGLGQGHGHLIARRATVSAGGRRMPRPVELDLWLPGPDGRVSAADAGGLFPATRVDDAAHEVAEAVLTRAG